MGEGNFSDVMNPVKWPESMNFKVLTRHDDIMVQQQLLDRCAKVIAECVMDTREKGIRKALIEMGWKPPRVKKRKGRKL